MTMQCLCEIPEDYIIAGRAMTLCHHTPTEEARDLRSTLWTIMNEFPHALDAEDLFTLPPNQLAKRYINRVVSARHYPALDDIEHKILIIQFLKQLSLTAQSLEAYLISEIQENPAYHEKVESYYNQNQPTP